MSRVRKAIAAAVAAGLAAAVQALRSGAPVDGESLGVILAAAIVAGLATYRIRNADRE